MFDTASGWLITSIDPSPMTTPLVQVAVSLDLLARGGRRAHVSSMGRDHTVARTQGGSGRGDGRQWRWFQHWTCRWPGARRISHRVGRALWTRGSRSCTSGNEEPTPTRPCSKGLNNCLSRLLAVTFSIASDRPHRHSQKRVSSAERNSAPQSLQAKDT
jgi:hypothetical protein